MQALTWIFILLLASAVGFLLYRLKAQGQLLQALQQEQRELAAAWRESPVDFSAIATAKGRPIIAVEILNPVQLAVAESPLAGHVNNFVPGTIRRIVYQRTEEIMRAQLIERGVEAEITIHGLD